LLKRAIHHRDRRGLAGRALVLERVGEPAREVAVGVVDRSALLDRAPDTPGELAPQRLGQGAQVEPVETGMPREGRMAARRTGL
jgi:hypothetical protein